MKTPAYWLLACAAGATACASSKPEARPDAATWREPAPAVVPLEDEPTAHTTQRPLENTAPARTARTSPATTHEHAATANEVAEPSATAEADNTKLNQRDRDERALTPMDQGSGENDVKITQQIRQAVMDDDSLSFTAKNVKIITVDGKVTLRGPVASGKERTTIGAAAKRVAGGSRVDNQLEIEK
jgi:hyperosmotically inducible protein